MRLEEAPRIDREHCPAFANPMPHLWERGFEDQLEADTGYMEARFVGAQRCRMCRNWKVSHPTGWSVMREVSDGV